MAWKIEFDRNAAKEFKKLDASSQILIRNYLRNKVAKANHPKDLGKPLRHNYSGLWRYRIEKYRVLCSIEEKNLVVLVLRVGKRDEIYN